LEVPEVGAVDGDLGGDDDLILADGGLGVVALDPAARGLDVARVRIADIDLPDRHFGRLKCVRRPAEPATVLHPPARPVSLVVGVGPALNGVFFLQAPLGFFEPVRAGLRD
jgi:hypothetical protein